MKIVLIHQYFKLPHQPGANRTFFIVNELSKRGHDIIVITQDKFGKKKINKIKYNDLNIIYIKNNYSNEFSVIKRFISYFRFMYLSTFQLMKVKNVDVVIASSTPLSVGFPPLIKKKIHKTNFIFEVRDLWPEVPIQMGAIKNYVLIKILRNFEKYIYSNAKHIIALSPGMVEGVLQYVNKSKVTFIPNMSKNDIFYPHKKDNYLMKQMNISPNKFTVIYFGTMGIANDMMYTMNAIKILNDQQIDKFQFIFLGEGKLKNECIEYTKIHSLKNVSFYDRIPMEQLAEIINLSDVSLVTFQNIPILSTNSPNKLFDTLAAGKPVIVNSSGWTKNLVEKEKCGFYVDPKNSYELARILKELELNPTLRLKLGLNARRVAETNFDYKILTEKYSAIIESLFKI